MAHKTLPAIDTDKYPPRRGLEGPFRFASGKVLYYDAREGKYYDSTTDMYVSNEDMEYNLYPNKNRNG